MPGISRLGDNARVEHHTHEKGCCPQNAVGPAISASSNVIVNGVPALRLGDLGVHVSCCGPNLWTVIAASGQLFLNGSPAVRLGDTTLHCAITQGKMIEASGDVSDFSPMGVDVLGPAFPRNQREIFPWVYPECIPGVPTAPDMKPFLWDPAAAARRERAASEQAARSTPHYSADPRTPDRKLADAKQLLKAQELLGTEEGQDKAKALVEEESLAIFKKKAQADAEERTKNIWASARKGITSLVKAKEEVRKIMENVNRMIEDKEREVQEIDRSEGEGRDIEIVE